MLNSQVATLPLTVIWRREEATEPEKDLGVAVGTPGKAGTPRTKNVAQFTMVMGLDLLC